MSVGYPDPWGPCNAAYRDGLTLGHAQGHREATREMMSLLARARELLVRYENGVVRPWPDTAEVICEITAMMSKGG